MSNMNSRQRKKKYRFLVKRDGEFCKNCKKTPPEVKLVVDHKDNNNSNNHPNNHQFLCRKCNYNKNPRQPFAQCESERKRLHVNYLRELDVSRNKEPLFRDYALKRIAKKGEVEEDDLIYSSAELLNISPITTKRYLGKMCSNEGDFDRMSTSEEVIVTLKTKK